VRRENIRSAAARALTCPREQDAMTSLRHEDPAERSALMRLFYRGWRPTRLGRRVNRIQGWLAGLGLPPSFMVVLEVRGRASGRPRSTPVMIASVDGQRYLVSMLGPESGAPLSDFAAISGSYPVFRIDTA
jgi:hypothetical protein